MNMPVKDAIRLARENGIKVFLDKKVIRFVAKDNSFISMVNSRVHLTDGVQKWLDNHLKKESPMTQPSRNTRNVLNSKQIFELGNWFKTFQEAFIKEQTTPADAAKAANKALGFHVTESNMTGLFSESPNAVVKHEWPSTRNRSVPSARGNAADIKALAEFIISMADSLDVLVPYNVSEIVNND